MRRYYLLAITSLTVHNFNLGCSGIVASIAMTQREVEMK